MKVAFVVPSFARKPIGGIRVVYNYANTLVSHGHDVTVVHVAFVRRAPHVRDGRPRQQMKELLAAARDVTRGAPEAVTWQGIDPAVRLEYVPALAPRFVPDGDAVVATAWQTADGVAGLGPEKGRPCYLIQHHETWSGRSTRVDETWRLPMRKLVIASWLEARAAAMGLSDVHRVSIAIDGDRFRILRPISPRPKRIAMLYSRWAWKGADEGIAALARVRERVPDVQAVLFGASPRPAHLPRWIEYQWDPAQDALAADVYNGSSIYLCPSHAEGWHLPPAEAMACGTAVVSTDIEGVRDYADAGTTALLSTPGDVDALAGNLISLLRDEARRVRLAIAGNARMARFTWERATHQLEGLLFEPAVARA